jgi:hypothetical protein
VAALTGTALPVAVVVVGSRIMAERLAAGNEGLALLANSLATAGGLIVLIATSGPSPARISTRP